jgi:hypothetical protein
VARVCNLALVWVPACAGLTFWNGYAFGLEPNSQSRSCVILWKVDAQSSLPWLGGVLWAVFGYRYDVLERVRTGISTRLVWSFRVVH